MMGGMGGAWSAPGSSPWLEDFAQEREILQVQQLGQDISEAYQAWRNGREDSAPTRAKLETGLKEIRSIRKRLKPPALQKWVDQQGQQAELLLGDLTDISHRQSLAELQQRWKVAVLLQRDLLAYRRSKLPALMSSKAPPAFSSYYQWQASLLTLLESELKLAEGLAKAFESQKSSPEFQDEAVRLYGRALKVKAPGSCKLAQQAYLNRFTALVRLCQAAQSLTDPDLIETLKSAEADYRKLALASDQARVRALGELLKR